MYQPGCQSTCRPRDPKATSRNSELYSTNYDLPIKHSTSFRSHIRGCFGKSLSDKLQKLRNRAFRITPARVNYDIRSVDILKSAAVCKLQDEREQQNVRNNKIEYKMLPIIL